MQGFEFHQYIDAFPMLKKHFKGIVSIDTLPRYLKLREFLICNTDLSSGSGQHWFILLKNTPTSLECFDSLGISTEKKALFEKYCKFRGIEELEFNETSFQPLNSNSCGLYALYYIIQRLHNLDLSFQEILEEIFDDKNKEKNEQIVQEFCLNIKM